MSPRIVPLLAALLLSAPLRAQAPPTPASAPGLEQIDLFMRQLRQAAWTMPEQLGHPAADESGRRLEDDLAEYFLTDATLARFDELRAQLAAGNGDAAAQSSATMALQQIAMMELCHQMALKAYWQSRAARDYQRAQVARLIEKLPEAERQSKADELRDLDAGPPLPRSLVGASMQYCTERAAAPAGLVMAGVPPVIQAAQTLVDGYNTLRLKLAAELDGLREPGTEPDWVNRGIPCPAPAANSSNSGYPRMRSQPDVARYYPRAALDYGATGLVQLLLHYDNTGCVTAAAVRKSSGSEELDAAALQIAFQTALLPAVVDGTPQAGAIVLPVKFSINSPFFLHTPPAQVQP